MLRKNRGIEELRRRIFALVFVCMGAALFPLYAMAQSGDSLTLTVTPPLFQLTIGPGESWASSLKVVNSNPYDVTLYSSVMNFAAKGDKGQGKLTPIVSREDSARTNTLAEWIVVSGEPFIVPKGTSREVPFSIVIPPNAPPGGHYAAILVGTQSLGGVADGPSINVSSLISTLFFVRIKGEVVEKGRINSFLAEHSFYFRKNPEVKLTLQFENDGNIHLQPRGDISIVTMWGKEVGTIPINENTNFGNVLPDSARTYDFTWKADESIFYVGLYRAIATVTFGEDGHQNIDGAASFWIIPLQPLLRALGALFLFVLVITFLIRRYIRRSLAATVVRMKAPTSPEKMKIPPFETGSGNIVDLRPPQKRPDVRRKIQ